MNARLSLAVALAAAAAFTTATPARAAQSYDSCTGMIASVPALISTQGVWCLSRDFSIGQTTGSAILVEANNVTIDCNHYKLGGLSAGVETLADGIRSSASNTTVRNCNVRGFLRGIHLDATGNGGHVVEDNRLEANRLAGIRVYGDGSVIRRNTVLDTGTTPTAGGNTIAGIWTSYDVDVLDNMVRGVVGMDDAGAFALGVNHSSGASGVIAGNRISGLVRSDTGYEVAIFVTSSNVIVRDNYLTRTVSAATPVTCTSGTTTVSGNTTSGPGTNIMSVCHNAGGNTSP